MLDFAAGFTVVDDSYNSNPRSLIGMVRTIAEAAKEKRRRIVIAGEMLELGAEGPELHRNCGREAARAGLELIVAVQGQAKEILEGALESGVDRSRLKFVRDALQAGDLLVRTLKKGDVVLIKGSRGVKLDQAINTVRAAFSSMEP